MKKWLVCIALAISTSLNATESWIQTILDAQIEEDMANIPAKSFTDVELFKYFQELSDDGQQAIFCKIRANRAYWKFSSIRNDESRNKVIRNFIEELLEKYPLPNMDFIISTEDGVHHNSKYPLFAFAANTKSKKNVCLFPDFEALAGMDFRPLLGYAAEFPWKKKINKMFFRGAGTGQFDPENPNCFGNDRARVVLFSHDHPSMLEADLTDVYQGPIAGLLSRIGKPLVASIPVRDHFKYKYLLDVDGNSTTYSRCRWILVSNSVLLKVSSDLTQWYYKLLMPFVNYIPIQQDLSDLENIYEWLVTHDSLAYQIAMNGQMLGLDAFSRETLDRYVYQLLLRYSEKSVETVKCGRRRSLKD